MQGYDAKHYWIISSLSTNRAASCIQPSNAVHFLKGVLLKVNGRSERRQWCLQRVKVFLLCFFISTDWLTPNQGKTFNNHCVIIHPCLCVLTIPLLWGGFWVRSRRMLIWCTAPKGSNSSFSSVSDQERGICPTNILMESGSGWSKCSSDPFILLPLLKQTKRKWKEKNVINIQEFTQKLFLFLSCVSIGGLGLRSLKTNKTEHNNVKIVIWSFCPISKLTRGHDRQYFQ